MVFCFGIRLALDAVFCLFVFFLFFFFVFFFFVLLLLFFVCLFVCFCCCCFSSFFFLSFFFTRIYVQHIARSVESDRPINIVFVRPSVLS